MAWISIPAPGTEYGPCKGTCSHTDCEATREMAAAVCHFCNEAIDYQRALFSDPDGPGFVHAVCLMATV